MFGSKLSNELTESKLEEFSGPVNDLCPLCCLPDYRIT